MNREDIIRMAREADLCSWVVKVPEAEAQKLERFAALVAAAAKAEEREACAKVCEKFDCENPYIGQARAVAFEIRQKELQVNQTFFTKIGWWMCDFINHPFPRKGWIYNGQYHRDCRFCGRIISLPCKGAKDDE